MKRDYSEDMLVVVAPERRIEAEWRVVVAEGQVLTASQYKQDGKPSYQSELPDAVQTLAETIAACEWQPDPIWMLDLCWADGAAHVLEINLFSCAAFYQCDLAALVKAASKIAQASFSIVAD